ncbi:MAG: sigma-54 dependent transcriptional regulator [Candidatus Lernaella stagnicola]|nr:sigma-54 dependent transcriptional regulator [Candidatus Lernaella stagnicola]
MAKPANYPEPIFVVDDEPMITETLSKLLTQSRYTVHVFHDAESAIVRLAEEKPFLVMLDLQLPGMTGMEALELIREKSPETEVVMISGYGTISRAVEAMKRGAVDFLAKPLQLSEVLSRVSRIHETNSLRHEVARLRSRQKEEFFATLYQSEQPTMATVHHTIRQVSQYPNIVALITGESGTGKEVLARMLHYQSRHAEGAFVAVNCAAIPESLIEAELFGYEPGAFTDALTKGRAGKIQKAAGGTFFLDEIGELAGHVQVKLLRFLQDRVVVPLGGHEGTQIDCNILAATHRDPEAMLAQGLLREDLYYRINVIRLHVPSLRERPEDILAHADAFLDHFNRSMERRFKGFDRDAMEKMTSYGWPGNLRELRNVIERACLLAEGLWITSMDLLTRKEEAAAGPGSPLAKAMSLDLAMRIYAKQVLDITKGNKSEAARILNVSRNRLKRILSPE